jgi:Uma2 family endonuclease
MAAIAGQRARSEQSRSLDREQQIQEAIEATRRRFTVEEFHRMAEAGIFDGTERVELIDGEVVERSPIGSEHSGAVNRCNRRLTLATGERAVVSVQNPLRLGDHTEPQPDLALLRPRDDFYSSSHPGPAEVLLVIEVADTSLPYDREVKLQRYASAGIPESWVLVLADEPSEAHLEVHREPRSRGYRLTQRLYRGDRVTLQAFPNVEIAVDDLLGSHNAPKTTVL